MLQHTFRYSLVFLLFSFYCCSEPNYEDIREVVEMKEVLELKQTFEDNRGYAFRLWCDQNYIYTSMDPDFLVHAYNYSGKEVKTFGKKGPAPFENGEIWSFTKDKTNNIYWMHDISKQLIKKVDLETDTLIATRKIITMNNVLYIDNKKFTIPRSDDRNKSHILSVYDFETGLYIKDYDLLKLSKSERLQGMEHLRFVYEGNWCRNKNYAVYYCYSSAIFFVIDLRNYSIKTLWDVRRLPIPEPYVKNNEVQLKPKLFASTSAAMDDKYLYSLTTKDVTDIRGKGKFQIDVYDIEANEYKGSVKVEKLNGVDKPREIAVYADNMVVLFDSGTINIYKIKTSGLPLLSK